MAGSAQADEVAAQVWQGQYQSNALKQIVYVRLAFNTSPPELRFEPMGCSVGLQLVSKDSTGVYSVVRYKQDELSGPYCINWLRGTLSIKPSVDGQQLNAELVNKQSKALFTLKPAP
jgi:hypothetical protein